MRSSYSSHEVIKLDPNPDKETQMCTLSHTHTHTNADTHTRASHTLSRYTKGPVSVIWSAMPVKHPSHSAENKHRLAATTKPPGSHYSREITWANIQKKE